MYYVEYWDTSGLRQREGTELLEPSTDDRLTILALADAPAEGAQWDAITRTFATPSTIAPEPVLIVSKLAFLRDRLGLPALAATLAKEATDPQIAAFRMLIDNADVIHLDDPSTMLGVGYLETLGILQADDVARILAPVEG